MHIFIEAHRIGLSAYFMLAKGTREKSPGSIYLSKSKDFRKYNDVLFEQISSLSNGTAITKELFIKFPPFVLHLLKQTENLSYWEYIKQVQDAIVNLNNKDKYGLTPLLKSRLIAYHALFGQCDSTRWILLGNQLFGNNFCSNESISHSDIDGYLNTLRIPYSSTDDRCHAIEDMAKIFNRNKYWHQIENILYSNQFAYPLLVTEYKRNTDYGRIAFSLPVSIDIDFSNPSKRDAIPYGIGRSVTDDNRIISEWIKGKYSSLDKSVKVGKQLWRAKHGNNGIFREIIEQAGVEFNFSVAQKIVVPLFKKFDDIFDYKNKDWKDRWHINLVDGSAEPYFSQIVLQRILGKSTVISSAITGLIGDQMEFIETPIIESDAFIDTIKEDNNIKDIDITLKPRQLLLNYKFDIPDYKTLSEKLKFVFVTRTYDRIALPRGARVAHRYLKDQTVEVKYTDNMQTLSDIVQVKGWRQHQYIRCPDLSWVLHTREGKEEIEKVSKETFIELIEILEKNNKTILDLNNRYSPILIAAALRYINNLKRNSLSPPPPSLSWAFIRINENEQDIWFWELIWECIGASRESFNQFIKNSTHDQIIHNLENALNRFTPDKDHPSHRTPDIIVIIGANLLKNSSDKSLNPTSRPFIAWNILSSLEANLDASVSMPLIGRTRFILLPDKTEEDIDDKQQSLDEITEQEIFILTMLSVFKNGFTQYAATLLASDELGEDYSGIGTRQKILDPFVSKKLLRLGQAIYHIPSNIVKQIQQPFDQELMARRYYLAGISYAPYASADDFPSLALDVAFSPINIHDAEFYLRKADTYAYGIKTECIDLKKDIRDALNYIRNIEIIPSWALVNTITKTLKSKNNDVSEKNKDVKSSKAVGKKDSNLTKERDAISEEAKENAEYGRYLVDELLSWDNEVKKNTHPSHLRQAAIFYETYIENLMLRYIPKEKYSENNETIKQLIEKVFTYYELSLYNSECPHYIAESDYNKLITASWYISTIRNIERIIKHKNILLNIKFNKNIRIATLENIIKKLIKNNTPIEGIEFGYLINLCDSEKDHEIAFKYYKKFLDIQNENNKPITYVKMIGCTRLAGMTIETLLISDELLNSGLWNEAARMKCKDYIDKFKNKSTKQHAFDRCVEGLALLEEKL